MYICIAIRADIASYMYWKTAIHIISFLYICNMGYAYIASYNVYPHTLMNIAVAKYIIWCTQI